MASHGLEEVSRALSDQNLEKLEILYEDLTFELRCNKFCSFDFYTLLKKNVCRCFEAEWCLPKTILRGDYVPIR